MGSYPIIRRFLATGLFVGFVISAATTPAGAVPDVRGFREFTVPNGGFPYGITAGPDGNLC